MDSDTLIDKDAISMRSSALIAKNEFMLQFQPGTSVQHINEWLDYYVQQTEKAQARLGKRTSISVDGMRIQNDGLVIVSGANVGEINQLNEIRAQSAAIQMGVEVMQGEIQPKPKGPPPRIPTDTIANKVKGIGQTVVIKSAIARKIR
jgi:hypothetical protein